MIIFEVFIVAGIGLLMVSSDKARGKARKIRMQAGIIQ